MKTGLIATTCSLKAESLKHLADNLLRKILVDSLWLVALASGWIVELLVDC